MNSKILIFVLLILVSIQNAEARFFVDLDRVAVADHERWYPLFKPVEHDLKTQLNADQTQALLTALDQRFGTTGSRGVLQILGRQFGETLPHLTVENVSQLLLDPKEVKAQKFNVVVGKGFIKIIEPVSQSLPQGAVHKFYLNTSQDQLEIAASVLEQALVEQSLAPTLKALQCLGNSYEIVKDLSHRLQLQKTGYRLIPQKMALQVAETPSPQYPHGRIVTLAYPKPAGLDEDFEGAGRISILAVQADRLLNRANWSLDQVKSEIAKSNIDRPYQLPEVSMNFMCRLLLQSLPAAE